MCKSAAFVFMGKLSFTLKSEDFGHCTRWNDYFRVCFSLLNCNSDRSKLPIHLQSIRNSNSTAIKLNSNQFGMMINFKGPSHLSDQSKQMTATVKNAIS